MSSTIKDILIDKEKFPSSRIVFLQKREQIQEALQAGYSRKQVYETLKETTALSFSYMTFCRWVRRYIGAENAALKEDQIEAQGDTLESPSIPLRYTK